MGRLSQVVFNCQFINQLVQAVEVKAGSGRSEIVGTDNDVELHFSGIVRQSLAQRGVDQFLERQVQFVCFAPENAGQIIINRQSRAHIENTMAPWPLMSRHQSSFTLLAGESGPLDQSDNPVAVVIAAHLAAQATADDLTARQEFKWALTRRLHERGYEWQDILELFRLLDWLLVLPDELEVAFRQKLTEVLLPLTPVRAFLRN